MFSFYPEEQPDKKLRLFAGAMISFWLYAPHINSKIYHEAERERSRV